MHTYTNSSFWHETSHPLNHLLLQRFDAITAIFSVRLAKLKPQVQLSKRSMSLTMSPSDAVASRVLIVISPGDFPAKCGDIFAKIVSD